MQDVPTSQRLNFENKRTVEIRLRKVDEAFVKFEEEQKTSEFMYSVILANRSRCS